MDLTTLNDDDFAALFRDVLVEKERRAEMARIPSLIEELSARYQGYLHRSSSADQALVEAAQRGAPVKAAAKALGITEEQIDIALAEGGDLYVPPAEEPVPAP